MQLVSFTPQSIRPWRINSGQPLERERATVRMKTQLGAWKPGRTCWLDCDSLHRQIASWGNACAPVEWVSERVSSSLCKIWRDYFYEACRKLHTHKHSLTLSLSPYITSLWILRAIQGNNMAISTSQRKEMYLRLIYSMVTSNPARQSVIRSLQIAIFFSFLHFV
jgi:hypothetical protein